MIVELADGREVGRSWRANDATDHARGLVQLGQNRGGGCHERVIALLRDCDLLLAGGMGGRLHDDLLAAGIDAVTVGEMPIDDAVRAVAEGALADRPELRCAGHHHDH